jgi:hypothetical protein
VEPANSGLEIGARVNLTAALWGSTGAQLTDRPLDWRSSDDRVAAVSPLGVVTGISAGTAMVTVTSGGVAGTAQVQVRAPAAAAAPPAAPPPNPAPAQPVRDPQVEITDLVRSYASALEARNLLRVKQLYPGMPGQQERDTREALAAMEDLHVRLTASNISVNDERASALVTGVWTYKGGKLDVRNTYQFERLPDGWRIVAIH